MAGSTLASVAFCEGRVNAAQAGGTDGRLASPSTSDTPAALESGPLGMSRDGRDGVIRLPAVRPSGKIPLLVFLHGATQNGESMMRRVGPVADELGVAVLAPDSRARTWDAIGGRFGDDVVFLNRALEHVFDRVAVDPERLAIGGFSDGASYALSLGLANGELFQRVIACSPGFVASAPARGRPRFFVSHGIADQILPIDQCSRVIVPRLRAMRYEVTYREFEGRHELPAAVLTEAIRWMIN
jgi:phospholipase/carboxylesterase